MATEGFICLTQSLIAAVSAAGGLVIGYAVGSNSDISLDVPNGLGKVANIEAVQGFICTDLETQLNAQWKRHAEEYGLSKNISFKCEAEKVQPEQLALPAPAPS